MQDQSRDYLIVRDKHKSLMTKNKNLMVISSENNWFKHNKRLAKPSTSGNSMSKIVLECINQDRF